MRDAARMATDLHSMLDQTAPSPNLKSFTQAVSDIRKKHTHPRLENVISKQLPFSYDVCGVLGCSEESHK